MVLSLLKGSHYCVAYIRDISRVTPLLDAGASVTDSLNSQNRHRYGHSRPCAHGHSL